MEEKDFVKWYYNCSLIKNNILSQVTIIDNLIGSQMAERFTFSEDDQVKFHKIFFEANKISFHAKIELYKQFLKEYEAEWLSTVPDFFDSLAYLKKIRNNFAHSMNPMQIELEQKEYLPYVLMYAYKDSQLIPIEYSKEEILEISDKIFQIKDLMLRVLSKIMTHREATKEEISKKIKSLDSFSYQDKTLQDSES